MYEHFALESMNIQTYWLGSHQLLEVAGGRRSWLPAPTWLRHTSGEKAIILARSPESYVEGHAHQLFIDSRLHLVTTTSLKILLPLE